MVTASGCAPPMPPKPGGDHQPAGQAASEVLIGAFGEGLVGALHDALRADVDPGSGRHLAVHGQALLLQVTEHVPVAPARHQVGVGDQHARRLVVGAEYADRLAALDQQGLVVLQPAQRLRRCARSSPSCGRLCRYRHRRSVRPAFRRRPGPGCSSACACAASWCQPLQLSEVPCGARIPCAGPALYFCGFDTHHRACRIRCGIDISL